MPARFARLTPRVDVRDVDRAQILWSKSYLQVHPWISGEAIVKSGKPGKWSINIDEGTTASRCGSHAPVAHGRHYMAAREYHSGHVLW